MDMESGPWYSKDYLTSPLNFLPELRQGFQLPQRLKLHDAMLRD